MTTVSDTPSLARWDEQLIQAGPHPDFFQLAEFGVVKSSVGWTPRFITVLGQPILALERRMPGFGRLWYVPRGSGLPDDTPQRRQFVAALRQTARTHRVFTVKYEPFELASPTTQRKYLDAGFTPSNAVQPTMSTIWVDLTPDLPALLQTFTGKTRYNIRQAEKAGVRCEAVEATDAVCRQFYDLFTETANGRFAIRPYEYYRLFWQTYCENGHGKIFFAYAGDSLLAASFVMLCGDTASRKDAATSKNTRIRGAAAALEYFIMEWLRGVGVTRYDLCGSPPAARLDDPAHPLYGVGVFKRGFSDHVVDYSPPFALSVKPLRSQLWNRGGEKLYRTLYWRLRHMPLF